MASPTSPQSAKDVTAGAITLSRSPGVRLRATQRPLRIVEPTLNLDVHAGKIGSVIASCHTIDQLEVCRQWIMRRREAGDLNVIDAAYHIGSVAATARWLGRRFEPHKRTWKWEA